MWREKTWRELFPAAWLSALTLNLGLLLFAASAALTYEIATRPGVYGYDATPSALAGARRSVESLARNLPPGDADRVGYWNSLVLAEVDAGDFSAVRGLLLAAPVMLPPRDAARLEAKLPAGASASAIAGAALVFLEPELRARLEGAPLEPSRPGALLLGAGADLDQSARALAAGQSVDELDISLIALGMAMREDADSAFQIGASALMAARRAGSLNPAVRARYRALIEEALPGAELRAAVADAASPEAGEDFRAALVEAVRRRLDPEGYANLRTALRDLADMIAAASPTGAVRLIGLAETPDELARLRLVALAAGEMSVAVAKRAPREGLLDAAVGTWRLSTRDWTAFAALVVSLLMIAGGAAVGFAAMLKGKRKRTGAAANVGADGDDLDAVYQIGPKRSRRR